MRKAPKHRWVSWITDNQHVPPPPKLLDYRAAGQRGSLNAFWKAQGTMVSQMLSSHFNTVESALRTNIKDLDNSLSSQYCFSHPQETRPRAFCSIWWASKVWIKGTAEGERRLESPNAVLLSAAFWSPLGEDFTFWMRLISNSRRMDSVKSAQNGQWQQKHILYNHIW